MRIPQVDALKRGQEDLGLRLGARRLVQRGVIDEDTEIGHAAALELVPPRIPGGRFRGRANRSTVVVSTRAWWWLCACVRACVWAVALAWAVVWGGCVGGCAGRLCGRGGGRSQGVDYEPQGDPARVGVALGSPEVGNSYEGQRTR